MLPIRGYPLKKLWYRMEAVADMDYTVVDNELERDMRNIEEC